MNHKKILPFLIGMLFCTGCTSTELENKEIPVVDVVVQTESISEEITEEETQTEPETQIKEQPEEMLTDTPEVTSRPIHDAIPDIDPVQLYDNPSENVEKSKLTRIDIDFVNKDYKISKNESAEALVTITGLNSDIKEEKALIHVYPNVTAEAAKRPLKITFSEEQTIDYTTNEKEFVLLTNVYDKTLIHNYIALDLYSYITEEHASMCEFVDVYSNDSYQGVYVLCNEINANRMGISTEIGPSIDQTDYLIEHNYQAYYNDRNNGVQGTDWFWMSDINECFKMKAPLSSPEHTKYINNYMDEVYQSIINKNWKRIQELVDVDSIIDGYMVNEIIKNRDCSQSGVYFIKKNGEKLKYATLGNYDLTFGSGDECEPESELVTLNSFLFSGLWEIPQFREAYIQKFNHNYQDYETHMLETIESIQKKYKESLMNDYNHWEKNYNWCTEQMETTIHYDEQIKYMQSWITLRMKFLYNQYSEYNLLSQDNLLK